ncbi:hypothetical protein ACTHQ4_05975 [Alkalicoccobacillus gibsonii]|uniref:hypothetical protein n=1 Tax=Alkalicoccobacillus gibsonii TaxID=79881 RepID=UPI003F7B691C
MIDQKYQVIIFPILIFCLLSIIRLSWLATSIITVVAFLAAALGHHVQAGVWGEWASKRLKNSLISFFVWICIIIMFWVRDLELPQWRLIVATSLIAVFAIFELLDAYIWHKKEQRELAEVERKSKENV